MPETPFRPEHAKGIDLSYKDHVSAAGYISPKQLKKFISQRRTRGLGPTTIYYAGVVAPVISASTFTLFESFFIQQSVQPKWTHLFATLLAASAGLSWFLIFNRLAQRSSLGRDEEVSKNCDIKIDATGILVEREHIQNTIEWPAIVDIRTTKHYIAFIVEGANDFFIPSDWFNSREEMMEAAKKIAALRPPPFNA